MKREEERLKGGILICGFLLMIAALSVSVIAATINVPGDYSTIQDAINNANAGDVINVGAGIYQESVDVNKSVSLIGSGVSTIINPPSGSYGFKITANNSLIKNFNINSTAGTGNINISVWIQANNVTINNNIITTWGDTELGIWICGTDSGCSSSNNITINKNNITINNISTGIYAEFSTLNAKGYYISQNIINAPRGVTLELYDVSDSIIDNNTFNGDSTDTGNTNIFIGAEKSNVNNITFSNNIIRYSDSASMVAFMANYFNTTNSNTVTDIKINRNTFDNWGSRALRIGSTNNGVSGVEVHNNNFIFSAATQALRNFDSSSVNALYNFWGNETPAFTALVSGNVLYTPWMNTPFDVTPPVPTVNISKNQYGYTDNRTANITLTNGTYMPDLFAVSLNNSAWTDWIEWGHSTTFNYTINLTDISLGGNLNDGNKTVYVKVKNYAENENFSHGNDTIILDTTYPLISYGSKTADNYANLSQNWIYVNVSAIEANEANITFKLYNSTGEVNSTTYTDKTRTINWTGLLYGTYTYNVTLTDYVNKINITETRAILIDAIYPLISIVYPQNNTNSSNPNLNINYTVSDNYALSSCWYSNDSYTVNNSITCGTNITTVVWSEGQHNVTIWANDSAGNVNVSAISFRIDTIIPYLTSINVSGAYFNGSDYFMSYGNDTYNKINITMTSNEPVDWKTFYIYDSLGNKVFRDQYLTDWILSNKVTWNGSYHSDYGSGYVPAGVYTFNLSSGDNLALIDYANNTNYTIYLGKVIINNVPVANNISTSLNEDTNTSITFNCTDENNQNLTYTIVSNPNNGTLSGSGNSRTYTPNLNFNGNDSFRYKCNDRLENSNTAMVNITITPVDDSPAISIYSPSQSVVFVKINNSQTFTISVSDIDTAVPAMQWSVDGTNMSGETNNSYTYNATSLGTFIIKVNVFNGANEVFHLWNLTVLDKPVATDFGGSTTNFSMFNESELNSVSDVVLEEVGYGVILFNAPLNLTNILDFSEIVKIERGVFALNSSFSQLNKPARITLTGLSYNTFPKIFYNAGFTTNANDITSECEFCNIISYTPAPTTNGTVVFDVEHFTSFKIGGSGETYDLDLLNNLDKCENGKVGNLTIDVKEPDEGDSFKPLEKMQVKAEVENANEDDRDVAVKAILYNIDKNSREEDAESDYENIDAGEDLAFELEIEMPDDFKKDDYILFIKAYEEEKESEQCDYEIFEVNLEKEEHKLIIEKLSPELMSVYAGSYLRITAEIQNFGESDEGAYIEAINDELGTLGKSDLFEIKEGADASVDFEIKIPGNVTEGNYTLQIKAIFEEGENSVDKNIYVMKSKERVIDKTISLTHKIGEVQQVKEKVRIIVLNFFLMFGIMILAGLVIVIKRRSRNP